MTNTQGIKAVDGGVEFLAYESTYGRDPSGYEGRMCAQTMGDRSYPRKARILANRDLDIRDLDEESAHFNIAAQTIENLVIDIEGSYFELVHVRGYL